MTYFSPPLTPAEVPAGKYKTVQPAVMPACELYFSMKYYNSILLHRVPTSPCFHSNSQFLELFFAPARHHAGFGNDSIYTYPFFLRCSA
jgi:hypothetical protein